MLKLLSSPPKEAALAVRCTSVRVNSAFRITDCSAQPCARCVPDLTPSTGSQRRNVELRRFSTQRASYLSGAMPVQPKESTRNKLSSNTKAYFRTLCCL
jgi:hypothetical protein